MAQSLKLLIAEDNPSDAELVIRALRRSGFAPEWQRVDTETDFIASLNDGIELVLSDFDMPQFTGFEALRLVQERKPDIPLIIVSGTIGEEVAVEAMRRGAADYLLKDRLSRLGPAVKQTLAKSRLQRERQQALEALRESEERFSLAYRSSPAPIAISRRRDLVVLEINDAFLRLFECARGDIVGHTLHDLDLLDTATASTLSRQLNETGEVTGVELASRSRTGRPLYVSISIRVMNLSGEPCALSTVVDITERRQAEIALRESEERFRGLIEHSTDVITVTDNKGLICFQSPSTQRVLGYQAEELMGRSALDLVAPEAVAKVGDGIERAWAGCLDPLPVEYRIRHRDGTWRIFQSIGRSMTDSTGRQQVVINSRDVTETRKLEQQFLRAQRLEAIGTLSSGIAHDLNNILAPMLMIAPLLKEKVSERQDLEMLAIIEQGARRGANIIKQLLTFSRGIEGERGPVQTRHLIKEMGEIMRETFPREITVAEKIEPNLRPITADATQIHQVLMNLCVNARDAISKAGRITLAAQNVKIEKDEASVQPPRVPGYYVCLTVADTGEGIPAENLDRIFEPFFTTKELGKGTGLGLSTVLGIVKSHGGFVTVASEPGRGTAFHVHLPASMGANAAVNPREGPRQRGRRELILVVDDEESIRRSLRLLLVRENYRVLAAADGHEALTLFATHRDEVALVLTDLMMPGMNGVTLIRALIAMAPRVRIVAASGLHDQDRSEELDALGVKTVLVKPCGSAEILEAVQRELEQRATDERH